MNSEPLLVDDTFHIPGRGLVVATNRALAPDEVIKIGARVTFHGPEESEFRSRLVGFELGGPPDRSFAFLLEAAATKEDVPVGARVVFDADSSSENSG